MIFHGHLAASRLAVVVSILGIPVTAQGEEGKREFEQFRCGVCHGADGNGINGNGNAIAGMEAKRVIDTSLKMILSGKHEDHVSNTGCADSPTPKQLMAIGRYVESLTK